MATTTPFKFADLKPARLIINVPYACLTVRPGYNVREDYGDLEELIGSVTENGVTTPFEGWDMGDHLDIERGHRRHRAVGIAMERLEKAIKQADGAARKALGEKLDRLKTVPFTQSPRTTGVESNYDLAISNDGKGLNPLELAELFQRQMKLGQSEADIRRKTGFTKTAISNCFLLLNDASPFVIASVKAGKIASTLAIEVVRQIPDKAQQDVVVAEAIRKAQESGRKSATAKHLNDTTRAKVSPSRKSVSDNELAPERPSSQPVKKPAPEKVKTVRIRKKDVVIPRKTGFAARTLVGEVVTVKGGESRGFVCTAFISLAGVKPDRKELLRMREEAKLAPDLLVKFTTADEALHTALLLAGELMDKAAKAHKGDRKFDVVAAQAALDKAIKPVHERLHPKKAAPAAPARTAGVETLVPDAISTAPTHIIALRDGLKKRLGARLTGDRWKTLNFAADYLQGRYTADQFEKFFTEFLLGRDRK